MWSALNLVDPTNPPAENPIRQFDDSYLYYHFYVEPSTGARCTRVVVVRFTPLPGTETKARGIVTSWARTGWREPEAKSPPVP